MIPNPEDNDYWHDGQITEVFGEHAIAPVFLVRLRSVIDSPPRSQLFALADLIAGMLFETEAELTAMREWNPDGNKPHVIPMRQ
jgi:hypothetical protein